MIDWLPALRASSNVTCGNLLIFRSEVVAATTLIGQKVEQIGVSVLTDRNRRQGHPVGQRVVEQALIAFSRSGA